MVIPVNLSGTEKVLQKLHRQKCSVAADFSVRSSENQSNHIPSFSKAEFLKFHYYRYPKVYNLNVFL